MTAGKMSRLLFVSLLLAVAQLSEASSSSPRIQSFHLHPTSELLVSEQSRRHLHKLPQSWADAASSSAIYATLPKEEDVQDPHNHLRDVQNFHAQRHLSRYERLHLQQYDDGILDAVSSWDGTYNHTQDDYYLLNDDDAQNHRRLYGRRTIQTHKDEHSSQRHLQSQQDPYHLAPLNQGYGTHYVNLWVGTPTPQRKTVIVDTGSHYTAFPCTGCTRCGDGHHTDPFYEPSLSETFRPLQCNECIRGASCQENKCIFSQSYTEGSSWNAYLAEDRVYCGGNDVLDAALPENTRYSIPFMFGCQTTETGLFVTQLADGIMGMSAHESTLPKKLYDHHKIDHNMFTMCFQRQLTTSIRGVTAGVMTMGGIDASLSQGPMVYARNVANMGWYTVYVKNIYIQDNETGGPFEGSAKKRILEIPMDLAAVNSGKGVIVDSGTTDTYLHKKLSKSFNQIWKQVTGKDYHHKPISLTKEQLEQLPTILVQCAASWGQNLSPGTSELLAGSVDPTSPDDVLISIPATNYMEYSPLTKRYTSRIYFTETNGGVLGANAMIGHNVLFDWENGRVGFAKSDCEYRNGEQDFVEADESNNKNCAVSEPSLTETCRESLDLTQCQHSPNRVLGGFETWTMTVTNQGTDNGMSCERAAAIKAAYKGVEKSRIHCAESGVCTELRPCRVKCSDVSGVKFTAANSGVAQDCHDAWSACDASCTQTRVFSELWSDGVCHEKSRATRPCHTGVCAKENPCHVPYTVRAAFEFRGEKAKWSSEALVDAIVSGVNTSTEKHQIAPGDVRVTKTTQLAPDGEELQGGVKAIVEISIVNPDAASEEASLQPKIRFSGFSLLSKGFRRSPEEPVCSNAMLYPLAKAALDVKEQLDSSVVKENLKKDVGFSAFEVTASTIVSHVVKDDEPNLIGSFSASFHTHRLKQYAQTRPFMTILFCLSVTCLVFGACITLELLIATLFKHKLEGVALMDNSIHSSQKTPSNHSLSASSIGDDEPLVCRTMDDERSESSQDDMLDRLLQRATCTPQRKLKTEDEAMDTPSLDCSMDESVGRINSRVSSPRKRKVPQTVHDVENDLDMACRKLEYGHK